MNCDSLAAIVAELREWSDVTTTYSHIDLAVIRDLTKRLKALSRSDDAARYDQEHGITAEFNRSGDGSITWTVCGECGHRYEIVTNAPPQADEGTGEK